MRVRAEHGEVQVREACCIGPRPDVLHHHVVLERGVVFHFVLRPRGL